MKYDIFHCLIERLEKFFLLKVLRDLGQLDFNHLICYIVREIDKIINSWEMDPLIVKNVSFFFEYELFNTVAGSLIITDQIYNFLDSLLIIRPFFDLLLVVCFGELNVVNAAIASDHFSLLVDKYVDIQIFFALVASDLLILKLSEVLWLETTDCTSSSR